MYIYMWSVLSIVSQQTCSTPAHPHTFVHTSSERTFCYSFQLSRKMLRRGVCDCLVMDEVAEVLWSSICLRLPILREQCVCVCVCVCTCA